MLLLCDLNNVLASCCYFVERNLVSSWLDYKTAEATRHATAFLAQELEENSRLCGKSSCTMTFTSKINFNRHGLTHMETDPMDFMENRDGIGKYWDDLTFDQTRQILSLRGISIMGFNWKKLQRRLKNVDQNHPLATTANQLKDIISSSEKTTSRELFAALDKASEKTSFSNDIRDCKDDEIFEGSKPTTSNDVACVSYVIERKLVLEWFNSKAGYTSDLHAKLVSNKKSEQRDTDI